MTIALLVVSVALAGCAAPQEPPSRADPEADAVHTLEWRGHLRAGAASDAWAHMAPLAQAGRDAWNVSFHLDVRDAPAFLEVRLDWEAPAGSFQLMVIGDEEEIPPVYVQPRNDARPDTVNEYADAPPICLRIPGEAMTMGRWSVMAHAEAAVDAELAFTTRSAGGDVVVVDGAHAFPLEGKGTWPKPQACELDEVAS